MLNGEIYHDTDIASMMQEPGSGNHDVQCSGCLFSQDEKRSMSIMPKIEQSLSNISVEIIHPAESWNLREAKSAITLCLPGIWAADKWERCYIQISQISIVNLLYIGECVPLCLLMKDTEVLLSVIILRFLVLGNNGRNEITACLRANNSSSFDEDEMFLWYG